RRVERVGAVPELTYVSDLKASPHDAGVVYAAFDNHKMGDFKPYVYKSADRGRTWTSISGDLPARGTVYTVAEDPARSDLLFAGTEFGLYFSIDGGQHWIQLKGGLPTTSVRDLAFQERAGDLVIATFGRGFYVLDDLTPLHLTTKALLDQEAALLPVRPAAAYIEAHPLGYRDKGFQGANFYAAPNPPVGATFTYFLKDGLDTLKKKRQAEETKLTEKGGDLRYPSFEALKAEDREEGPVVMLTVTDGDGNVVRRLTGPASAGFHRVSWDLHYASSEPVELNPEPPLPWSDSHTGPMVVPGPYKVALAKRVGGVLTPIGDAQPFTTETLGLHDLSPADRTALLEFQKQVVGLQRAVLGAVEARNEAAARVVKLKKAIDDTPKADAKLAEDVRAIETRLKDIQIELEGDTTKSRRGEPTLPAIQDRVGQIVGGSWNSTSAPTGTQRDGYDIAAKLFGETLGRLRGLIETDLRGIEDRAEAAGAPWTPGRLPRWPR
ncbi:MAG: glycosyl hydrolase, partial [Vicinamibacteria bacterium]